MCALKPHNASIAGVKHLESLLKEKVFKAFKIFPGYYNFYPHDNIYLPFYRLAEKHNVPVIIHSGATLSNMGLAKYADPIHIDDAAVKFPGTTIIMAHIGNPWIDTAKAVISKNQNVYADLSGLFEGGRYKEEQEMKREVRELLQWTGDEKLLYGSDWPIVRMKEYIMAMKKIVPKASHDNVFYNNAKKMCGI